MRHAAWLAVLCLTGHARAAEPLTVDRCVEIALDHSAEIAEVEAKVRGYEARLAEVESIYWPKLFAVGWIAPMFTVQGTALGPIERDYSPGAWGPYTNLEALLALPLYTFGRAEAGAEAARARADVERARVAGARGVVALEVRRLYYLHLFASSMLPSLETGGELVDRALAQGEQMYASGSGSVTQVDLMKLTYGQAEVRRYRRTAEDGAALALAALSHTMGMPSDTEITLADRQLPRSLDGDEHTLEPLATLIERASKERPEWRQLERGRDATISLADAERLANAPALFAAGQFRASWTPTRDDTDNPYHFDPYNDLFGGVAIGLQWQLDPMLASAKVKQAEALGDEVAALRRFAETGIPLQVRQAHQAVARHLELARIAKDAVKATRKWMTFASAAYETGTGEARDVLEGLAAYLSAKRNYYEQVRDYHTARAELLFATGRIHTDNP